MTTLNRITSDSNYDIVAIFSNNHVVKIAGYPRVGALKFEDIRYIVIMRGPIKLFQYHGKLEPFTSPYDYHKVVLSANPLTSLIVAQYLLEIYRHLQTCKGLEPGKRLMNYIKVLMQELSGNKITVTRRD